LYLTTKELGTAYKNSSYESYTYGTGDRMMACRLLETKSTFRGLRRFGRASSADDPSREESPKERGDMQDGMAMSQIVQFHTRHTGVADHGFDFQPDGTNCGTRRSFSEANYHLPVPRPFYKARNSRIGWSIIDALL